MLPKQAKKNYLCSQIEKRKTMKHTNPQVEQMTSFIVMDVLERANELQKQGIDIIHLEVGEPDFDVPACDSLVQGLTNGVTSKSPYARQRVEEFFNRKK